MSSKRARFTSRRCPLPKSYQIVDGFTRVPVPPDGNCFYTASGFFCDLNAAKMRALLMKYFLYKKAEYTIFFESEKDFVEAVKDNCESGVWNSELCDIVPHAAAQVLRREIIIHNYVDGKINLVHTPVENAGAAAQRHTPIHLFRRDNHYEILLDNNKKPNKNVWPLPDVSEFEGIDLVFPDSDSDSDTSSEGEYVSDVDPI